MQCRIQWSWIEWYLTLKHGIKSQKISSEVLNLKWFLIVYILYIHVHIAHEMKNTNYLWEKNPPEFYIFNCIVLFKTCHFYVKHKKTTNVLSKYIVLYSLSMFLSYLQLISSKRHFTRWTYFFDLKLRSWPIFTPSMINIWPTYFCMCLKPRPHVNVIG